MGKAATEEVHRSLKGVQVVEVIDLSIEDIIAFVSSMDSNDSILMTRTLILKTGTESM